jgi:hypothetical protein
VPATDPSRQRVADSCRGLYPAEVLTFENRAKGLALQGWLTNVLSCINTFGSPSALGSLGYIGKSPLCALCRALIFSLLHLCDVGSCRSRHRLHLRRRGAYRVPPVRLVIELMLQTKQLSLEETSEIFNAPNPKKRSFELAAAARARVKREKELTRGFEQ